MKTGFSLGVAALLMATPALAAQGDQVGGQIKGNGIEGEVSMTETASGAILVEINATNVPEGAHGVHVHETGACEEPDFKSAGGHLAGNHEHGVLVEGGPHPGDLPNVHVQGDGVMHVEYFVDGLSLGGEGSAQLLDDDGSALIIHSGADDYESQPSGDAGDRLACAVLEAAD